MTDTDDRDDIAVLADAMSRHSLLAYHQERAAAVLSDLAADGWRLIKLSPSESECERFGYHICGPGGVPVTDPDDDDLLTRLDYAALYGDNPDLFAEAASALRKAETELATAQTPYMFVEHHRETLEAWLRGCEAHTWEPTAATQDVLASLLRLVLLAGTSQPADEVAAEVRGLAGPDAQVETFDPRSDMFSEFYDG